MFARYSVRTLPCRAGAAPAPGTSKPARPADERVVVPPAGSRLGAPRSSRGPGDGPPPGGLPGAARPAPPRPSGTAPGGGELDPAAACAASPDPANGGHPAPPDGVIEAGDPADPTGVV